MLRLLRAILLALLIGTLLTILTSWAFAIFGRYTHGELVAEYDKPVQVPAAIDPGGWDLRSWLWWAGTGIRRDLVSECEWMGSTLGMTMDGRRQWTLSHVRVGFPFLAMTWWDYASNAPAATEPALTRAWYMGIDVGIKGPTFSPGQKRWGITPRLPIRPLWWGFALNVLVYAAASMGANFGLGAWKRAHRRKRGRCVACGYEVKGLERCPECGTVV